MSNQSLKSLARVCKALAIVVLVVLPLWVLHPPFWGITPIATVQIVSLAILSLIPNRWLVFSRIPFAIFLLLTLLPFPVFLHISAYNMLGILGVFVAFVPLPLSLVLSRMRFQSGEKFMYA